MFCYIGYIRAKDSNSSETGCRMMQVANILINFIVFVSILHTLDEERPTSAQSHDSSQSGRSSRSGSRKMTRQERKKEKEKEKERERKEKLKLQQQKQA